MDHQHFQAFLFALKERTSGTVAVITYQDEPQIQAFSSQIQDALPEYQFYDLDLQRRDIRSLYSTLHDLLPAKVRHAKPVTYVVNLLNLGEKFYVTEGDEITTSHLPHTINFERDAIFSNLNHVLLIWLKRGHVDLLRREAPDFCDWIAYFFDVDPAPPSTQPVERDAILMDSSYDQPSYQERPIALENLYLELASKNSSYRDRLEMVSVLRELARHYAAQHDLEQAVATYQRALKTLDAKKDTLWYVDTQLALGDAQTAMGGYHDALETYLSALKILKAKMEAQFMARTHLKTAWVLHRMGQWDEALQHLEPALQHADSELRPRVYQALGAIYEARGDLQQARAFFKKANGAPPTEPNPDEA